MTIRNPFKKKPEKKATAPVRPAPTTYNYAMYTPVTDPTPPARSEDCGTGSPSSHHSSSSSHATPSHDHGSSHGSHSSHTSHDFGSHSFGGHDSGSAGCDSGGGF